MIFGPNIVSQSFELLVTIVAILLGAKARSIVPRLNFFYFLSALAQARLI